MPPINPKKIEEYQIILLKNPQSKVFAALTEAYRKLDLLDQALEISAKGVRHNPDYVSGLVAHCKVLYQLHKYQEALPWLTRALELNSENLLALRLFAHCHIQLKNNRLALQAYKKLLFYSPSDERAQSYVKQWEFLEGKDLPLDPEFLNSEMFNEWLFSTNHPMTILQVIDVLISKHQLDAAHNILLEAKKKWPGLAALESRHKIVSKNSYKDPILNLQKIFWQNLLQRIQTRRLDRPFLL